MKAVLNGHTYVIPEHAFENIFFVKKLHEIETGESPLAVYDCLELLLGKEQASRFLNEQATTDENGMPFLSVNCMENLLNAVEVKDDSTPLGHAS